MHCKCGYSFLKHIRKALKKQQKYPFKSYAVISDEEYTDFLQAEIDALQCENKQSYDFYKRLGRAAGYTNSMHICPECGRLVLVKKKSTEFYVKED